ncbi:M23 family metallopeptidase [Kitasatospora sp. NPDC002227]|uniref:M23 family metallopeptidase n=1 Tax=Kitasatospora sp. NPDC002227 TaxID=3154773 RepID=UPI0033184993
MGESSDRTVETIALHRFLTAGPAAWPELAPQVAAAVGAERLQEIVTTTLRLVGSPFEVADSPQGLLVSGPSGRATAWLKLDGAGRIAGLLLSPAPARLQLPPGLARYTARVFWCLLFLWRLAACWTADSRTGWLCSALLLAWAWLFHEGWAAPATDRLLRRAVTGTALAALASALHLPSLPTGGQALPAAALALAVLVTAAALARARTHRWGAGVTLDRFPLEGTWYVVQGGGRGLNHHAGLPEQRGAVDLVRPGPARLRLPRTAGDFPAYGAAVLAPCAGTVVAAVDGAEDQLPGVIRYAPAYGNHVVLDTGEALVKLAHLRPGSVNVTPGQVVRAGHRLGEVGNSGNSTEPHLHLHAERDGVGLDLRFADLTASPHRGRLLHRTAH